MDDAVRSRVCVLRGTTVWIFAVLALGWWPLMTVCGASPSGAASTVVAAVLAVVVALVTGGWWAHVGGATYGDSRTLAHALALGSLGAGWGAVACLAAQSLTTGTQSLSTDEPGLGVILAAPFLPLLVAVPLILFVGVGYIRRARR